MALNYFAQDEVHELLMNPYTQIKRIPLRYPFYLCRY